MNKGMEALNNIGAIKTKRDNQFVKYYAPKQFEIINKELSKLDEIREIIGAQRQDEYYNSNKTPREYENILKSIEKILRRENNERI